LEKEKARTRLLSKEEKRKLVGWQKTSRTVGLSTTRARRVKKNRVGVLI
jgi:hypothetical protein